MTAMGLYWAHPERVWMLAVWCGVVLIAILLERRGSGALDRLIALPMQASLSQRPARWRRWGRLALLSFAGVAMALALLQPQHGERFVATPRVGAEIMIALDVSRSMLADDAAPNRLERAKAEIRDLLAYLRDDHVGLIAFAGRASVISPMTPDKSFLRLALDAAGPQSVPRGGTQLAEAIRRAVVGFGPPGPAQRALILITDGEDHDSFAVDAARAAAEVGIKIIAIGFGDEAGSPIFVRDPDSGARTQIRDGAGRPVMSRLNGDLLRELALATQGAYVPAGTGILDLASIYDAHIAGLTRGEIDEQGRTIRDEAYPFFVAAALAALVTGLFLVGGRPAGSRDRARATSRSPGTAPVSAAKRAAPVLLAALFVTSAPPGPALAQIDALGEALEEAREEDAAVPASTPSNATPGAATEAARRDPEEDPRDRFNRANAALAAGDPEAAAAGYRAARRDGADDPELRHAATYNLGVAAVARADAAEAPEAALAALEEAADWFRESVSQRPESEAPRANLEVVLRRLVALRDELAQSESGPFEAALDTLIEAQRAQTAGVAGLLEGVSERKQGQGDPDALASALEILKPAFAGAATEQRLLRAQVDELADRAERERAAILRMAEDVRSPEDALRAAQFEAVLVRLDEAIERMSASRRQLRRRHAERAYRRSAAALDGLKRARDTLCDPVEQIGVLLEEVARATQRTAALYAQKAPGGVPSEAALPAFLTQESLAEESGRLDQRVRELAERLSIGAERAAAEALDSSTDGEEGEAPPSPDEAAFRAALIAAAPRVVEGAEAIEGATRSIAAAAFRDALAGQGEAGQALVEAQEEFFDFARLLEVALVDQERVVTFTANEDDEMDAVREEYAPLFRDLQARNDDRGGALGVRLEREREKALAAAYRKAQEQGEAPAEDEAMDPVAIETARFEAAAQLLGEARSAMSEALSGFEAGERDGRAAAVPARRAAERMEALRRLFFSLLDHLKALAQDQVDVKDATEETVALAGAEAAESADTSDPSDPTSGTPSEEAAAERGPDAQARSRERAVEQSALETRAGTIADALLEQATALASEDAVTGEAKGEARGPSGGEPEADRTRRAAEFVAQAQLSMRTALGVFENPEAPLAEAPPAQEEALEALAEAIALLSPPPDESESDPEDSEGSQDESSDEGGEGEQNEPDSGEGAPPEPAPPEPQPGQGESAQAEPEESGEDPDQLLQGVRDREAERRRDREREERSRRSMPVEKDW